LYSLFFFPILIAFFQHYESLIIEAKSKRQSSISEAVENAVTSTMQDIQNKLEKCELEKNAVADVSVPVSQQAFRICI